MHTYLNIHGQVEIVLNLLESKVRKSDFSLYPFNMEMLGFFLDFWNNLREKMTEKDYVS